jgi:hypothetical protein
MMFIYDKNFSRKRLQFQTGIHQKKRLRRCSQTVQKVFTREHF